MAPHGNGSLPLERKLPLLILGLLSAVLAVAVAVSYYQMRQSAESSARQRLHSLSQVLASMIQQQMAARLVSMHRVAADTAVINALRTPARAPGEAANAVLKSLVGPADTLSPAMLLAPDGRLIGNVQLETPADLEQFRAQRPAPAADSGHVGKLSLNNNHTSFWISAPVRDHGQLLGYVAQERRFNTNPRALQPFHDLIGPEIELYIRNADDNTWVTLTGTPTPAPIRAEASSDSLIEIEQRPAGALLAASLPVRGTPLLITVEYPVRQILAGPRATARSLSVIAVLLAVLGAMFAWGISRQMTRPLVDLTQAAEAMASGEYSQRVQPSGGDEIGRLSTAFNRMAQTVEHAATSSDQAVVRLTQSAATQQFLADASRILAESLSDERLLADLAQFCVPAIADYCSIQIVDPGGGIRRLETAHYDRTQAEPLQELVHAYQYRVDGPGEVPAVIRSQKPLLVPSVDREAVLAAAPNDAIRELLKRIGPTAFLCVPLIARGRALGAISFTMTNSGRSFSHDDLDLAMELARRTAVAMDNAMIYRSSVALRLEAEAASSAKSDFLAKMSHEIRTPINAMMGYAELLEMGIAGPITEAQARQLARIRASGEHLTSLVNEILDLAKIEAGGMSVEPTLGSIVDAVDTSLVLIRPQASAKGVQLVNNANAPASPDYLGDPQRVQQILTNLLSNAVKFTPAGGSIRIECGSGARRDPESPDRLVDSVCIVVEDTGVGIGADDLERIFQPFVQVENGYTRAHGGTGLGLTISRSLAHMMGGDLAVESTPGAGSRFALWLPSPN
jgi:signal transduction histidine kinase